MRFEWDEEKRTSNLNKHKLDFANADQLNWDEAMTVNRLYKEEVRSLTYAEMDSKLCTLVWTWRDEVMRIISFRRANNKEIDRYEKTGTQ